MSNNTQFISGSWLKFIPSQLKPVQINECPESQLVPPYAGDSGQLWLFFYLWKTN